jgi:SAM-dependent methyltransferase
MLNIARSKIKKEPPSVRKRITLVEADMRDMSLDQRFGMCIVPFFSFHHLLTIEDQLDVLSKIREHLVPDGRLVFNLFNPNLKRPEGIQRLDKVIETEDQTVMRYSVQYFDRPNQITHGWLIHEFVDSDGLVRRKVTPFRLRYTFYSQAKQLLKRAGYDVESVLGGYDGRSFTLKSGMMIFTGKKHSKSQ